MRSDVSCFKPYVQICIRLFVIEPLDPTGTQNIGVILSRQKAPQNCALDDMTTFTRGRFSDSDGSTSSESRTSSALKQVSCGCGWTADGCAWSESRWWSIHLWRWLEQRRRWRWALWKMLQFVQSWRETLIKLLKARLANNVHDENNFIYITFGEFQHTSIRFKCSFRIINLRLLSSIRLWHVLIPKQDYSLLQYRFEKAFDLSSFPFLYFP